MWIFLGISAAILGGVTGVTLAKLLDKTAGTIGTVGGLFPPGTLDPIPDEEDPLNPGKKKFPFTKVISISVIVSIGIMIVKWVSKKLNVKLFK